MAHQRLTDEQKQQIIQQFLAGTSIRKIAEDVLGRQSRKSTVADFLQASGFTESYNGKEVAKVDTGEDDTRPVAAGETLPPVHKRKQLSGNRFVFVSAQNNSFVHDKFLQSLEGYCRVNDAQLIVSTFNYNMNGFQNGQKDDKDIWYDPKIRQYIRNEPLQVCEGLVFCGELNILPTAVRPLSGLSNYTGKDSAIIPHAKMQLESIPTSKHDPAKMLYTTGCVTQRNYIQKKQGQIAEWHHVFSAVVVEVDNEGDWFARHVNAESATGCFYDLDRYYTPTGYTEGHNLLAINYGDVHVAKLDEDVADVSWRDEDSITGLLKPEYAFLHDVFDHNARNHHNTGNPHIQFQLYKSRQDSVKDELRLTAHEIAKIGLGRDIQIVVVASNHDQALERWLREGNYKTDYVNAITFLELQLAKYKAMDRGDKGFYLFEYAIRKSFDEMDIDDIDIEFLKEDESFVLAEIEFGEHSHSGNNGARGSVRAFDMRGTKHNIGHTHSAAIMNGIFVAGVSGKLDMNYNKGGSSWSHSHILTYKNGKRCIVTLKPSKNTGKMKWRG